MPISLFKPLSTSDSHEVNNCNDHWKDTHIHTHHYFSLHETVVVTPWGKWSLRNLQDFELKKTDLWVGHAKISRLCHAFCLGTSLRTGVSPPSFMPPLSLGKGPLLSLSSLLHCILQGRLPVRWMAIESLNYSVYTTNSDVWVSLSLLRDFFFFFFGPRKISIWQRFWREAGILHPSVE